MRLGNNGPVPWLLDVAVPAFSQFWALLFPTECVCCQLPDASLCRRCRQRLRRSTVRPYRAEYAAGSLPEDSAGRVLPVVAAGVYRRELSLSLLAYKNRGHTDLGRTLAAALAGAVHHAVDGLADGAPVQLVPMPSTAAARRRRGYEPVQALLRQLHRRKMLPPGCNPAAALRVRPLWVRILFRPVGALDPSRRQLTRQATGHLLTGKAGQKGLGASARRTNVRGTMGLRHRRPRGGRDVRQCLIVDDVLTTGATIAEAHRVLDSSGFKVLGAVVLAATSPPQTDEAKPAGGRG
ncbi:ComF family protein [Arthrobacter castelli]|uniref:ComF family protein n=1 Tax=Arthrobacter castelli TaxID=271431 RepID=UPI0012DDCD50|nr:phosphoribosyltransferase family protein [Arthrobacter castelli]